MKRQELHAWIDSLTQDIEFQYQGLSGAICPFSRENISLCYDGHEEEVNSVDAAMEAHFIDGHSLGEICEELDI